MYIDYLTLMLVNLTAGLATLACWAFMDSHQPSQLRWVPGIFISGLVAAITGFHMIFTWPLPGSYNILFGEMSVFYGMLMLGLVLVLWRQMDLVPIALYAEFVGLAALLIGAQVLNLHLTKSPVLSGISFIWMGIVGVFAVPMLSLRKVPAFRILAAVGLAIAALLWAITGFAGYWGHVEPFAKWQPAHLQYEKSMQQPAPAAAAPVEAPPAPAAK